MGLSVIGVVLLVMGVVPLLLGLLPAMALGAFLYASRRQTQAARVSAARKDRRRASRETSSEDYRSAQDDPADERTAPQARRSSTQRSSNRRSSSSRRSRGARRHVDSPAARLTQGQYSDLEGADVRVLSTSEVEGRRASAATEGRWEPVEAPLPGYLDSARATRMPRNLDSTANGDWTSERMLEQAEALRTPALTRNLSWVSMNSSTSQVLKSQRITVTATGAQLTTSAPGILVQHARAVAQFGSAPRSHRGVRVQIPSAPQNQPPTFVGG